MNPRIARLRAEINSDVVTFQSKAEVSEDLRRFDKFLAEAGSA